MPSNGIIFIATGERYIEAANNAVASIKEVMPNVAVDLYCNKTHLADHTRFDRIHEVTDPHRRSKVDYILQSRFDRTLYLDTDVRITEDISGLFDVLDRFDIALTHAHARNKAATNEVWRVEIPTAFPQFNGGVILFRSCPEVRAFLEEWRDAYHSAGLRKDQVTLRELLWLSDLRLCTLPPEYNIRYAKYLWIWRRDEARPKILHMKKFHDQVKRRAKWRKLLARLGL